MFKKIVLGIGSILLGCLIGFIIVFYTPLFPSPTRSLAKQELASILGKKQVIGFLPYWLVNSSRDDYSPYITQLTYFGLTVGSDGHIQKLASETEEEPGWHALNSDALARKFANAQAKNLSLSLLVFSGEQEAIAQLISDPKANAQNLVTDVLPIMKEKGFTDLNLDIESVVDASDSARTNFTTFVQTVKEQLKKEQGMTLTIDVAGSDLIQKHLIVVKDLEPYVDYMVLMAYDYHFLGSSVTGPVGPLYGGGTISEYDTNNAISEMLRVVPNAKVILGVPLYGYQWEVLDPIVRAGVIPSTGIIMSSKKAQDLLDNCASCSAGFDTDAQEAYVTYKDQQTGTYHQFFVPDIRSTQAKVDYAKKQDVGGIALWALGYENSTILTPLKEYK